MSVLDTKGWRIHAKPVGGSLVDRLLNRWPDEIFQVQCLSDERYLLILKADVDFDSFEKLFKLYIRDLLIEEWAIQFRVFNADFSCDFTLVEKGNRVQ